jgi:hypothetical protein
MEVKLALGMIIISFILTGVNIMLYFQIEKLIKFLKEYKMEKLVSMQNEIQSLEESLALYTFMSMPDKEKEEFIAEVRKDMEGKNGR